MTALRQTLVSSATFIPPFIPLVERVHEGKAFVRRKCEIIDRERAGGQGQVADVAVFQIVTEHRSFSDVDELLLAQSGDHIRTVLRGVDVVVRNVIFFVHTDVVFLDRCHEFYSAVLKHKSEWNKTTTAGKAGLCVC